MIRDVLHHVVYGAFVSYIAVWCGSRISLWWFLPWRPRVQRADGQYDLDGRYVAHVRVRIVRARGRVVRVYVDEFEFQHCVVVWGLLRLIPQCVIRWFFTQRIVMRGQKRVYLSVSTLPNSHVHLVAWPEEVEPGDEIDLSGAEIVHAYDRERGRFVMTGAEDLDCWRHGDCAWIMR